MSENQRDPQYKLRWSVELRDKIAESAKKHNRSMNADIIARLEDSFDQDEFDQILDKNMPRETLKSTIIEFMASLMGQGVEDSKILGALDVMQKLEDAKSGDKSDKLPTEFKGEIPKIKNPK